MPELPSLLGELAVRDPAGFPLAMLKAFRESYDLISATCYLHCEARASLHREEHVGPPDSASAAPVATCDASAARAVATGDVVVAARSDGDGSLVVVPLAMPVFAEPGMRLLIGQRAFGAVCLWGGARCDARALAESARTVGPTVAMFYVASLERLAGQLRRRLTERVAYRRDFGSLAHDYVAFAIEELSVEAASVWLLDPRRYMLYRRRAATAAAGPKASAARLSLRSPSPIVKCFLGPTTVRGDEPPEDWNDSDSSVAGPSANWTALPIRLPDTPRIGGGRPVAAGVVELVNHFTLAEGRKIRSPPTWRDEYLAEACTGQLSVLVYQLLRTQDHESEYERLMHGARTSLQAARSHMQAVERFGVEEHLPPPARHYVSNAIAWIEDLEAQIERQAIVSVHDLELEPVNLFGDVLARLEVLVRGMNARRGEPGLVLQGLAELATSYRRLPRVMGNRRALDCVFRNLLDNSSKYCRPVGEGPPVVSIEVRPKPDLVEIDVADNGPGIPSDEADSVFLDGYRGTRARGTHPQGVGRGLHDCAVLMGQMRGNISLIPSTQGAAFRLELPIAGPGRTP